MFPGGYADRPDADAAERDPLTRLPLGRVLLACTAAFVAAQTALDYLVPPTLPFAARAFLAFAVEAALLGLGTWWALHRRPDRRTLWRGGVGVGALLQTVGWPAGLHVAFVTYSDRVWPVPFRSLVVLGVWYLPGRDDAWAASAFWPSLAGCAVAVLLWWVFIFVTEKRLDWGPPLVPRRGSDSSSATIDPSENTTEEGS